MPLDLMQKKILQLLAKHRNPESYVAGGVVINKQPESSRYSKDIDIFHESEEATQYAATHDIETLRKKGYSVDITIRQPGFVRCIVHHQAGSLKLDWVVDSAFRFFPVIEDKQFGYRLHDIDLATNKCLALANRSEVRDIIDIVQIHESYLSLSSCCWAASAKDPGLNPFLIIELLKRNSSITSQMLSQERLAIKIDPVSLKSRWMQLINEAEIHLSKFPPKDVGCIYLDKDNKPTHFAEKENLTRAKKHFGSVKGAWPKVSFS